MNIDLSVLVDVSFLDLGAWASESRKIAGEDVVEIDEDYDTEH